MSVTLRFIGTGAAEPVPAPGCDCPGCAYARTDATARRMQSGLALVVGADQYVVDCGPAAVAAPQWLQTARVRGVFVSHLHPDHALGLYSIRWAQHETPIPVFLPPEGGDTGARDVEHERVHLENWLGLEPSRLDFFSSVALDEVSVLTLELRHGDTPTQGFLFEAGGARVAYLLDGKGLPPRTAAALRDRGRLDGAVIDATHRPGTRDSRHNNLDEAIEIGLEIGARRVFLTHIGHHNLPKPELEGYVRERTAPIVDQEFVCSHDGLTIALAGSEAEPVAATR
ncbi:MAG TPA: MBL fold metallo-hydrolase [Gaiellaceae bacterium]|nr:MBL fold metallo-hydrolase [Gaiellaceae bacterium]